MLTVILKTERTIQEFQQMLARHKLSTQVLTPKHGQYMDLAGEKAD
ncbi:MAG: hypothetical protein KPI85_01815 [cyanobacterium endosymbiont of Epithemia adnata isolate EadnSB Bon19]